MFKKNPSPLLPEYKNQIATIHTTPLIPSALLCSMYIAMKININTDKRAIWGFKSVPFEIGFQAFFVNDNKDF